jgi:hypothetical protein
MIHGLFRLRDIPVSIMPVRNSRPGRNGFNKMTAATIFLLEMAEVVLVVGICSAERLMLETKR